MQKLLLFVLGILIIILLFTYNGKEQYEIIQFEQGAGEFSAQMYASDSMVTALETTLDIPINHWHAESSNTESKNTKQCQKNIIVDGLDSGFLTLQDSSGNDFKVGQNQTISIPCSSFDSLEIYSLSVNAQQLCRISNVSMKHAYIICNDTKPPEVINTFPANGEMNINKDVVITIQFDEDIIPSTINNNSIILEQEIRVEADIKFDSVNNIAIITPKHELTLERTYTIKLTNEITDWSRNSFVPMNWKFTIKNWVWSSPEAALNDHNANVVAIF